MASRSELVRLIHDTVCLCASKPHRFVLSSRDMDAIANRLLAAYPQLAAEKRDEWGVEISGCGATFTSECDSSEQDARLLQRKIGDSSHLVARTVYATPWEDA